MTHIPTLFRLLLEHKDSPYPIVELGRTLEIPYQIKIGDSVDITGNDLTEKVYEVYINLKEGRIEARIAWDGRSQEEVSTLVAALLKDGWVDLG
jgi:hypothetical protein